MQKLMIDGVEIAELSKSVADKLIDMAAVYKGQAQSLQWSLNPKDAANLTFVSRQPAARKGGSASYVVRVEIVFQSRES